MDPFTISVGIFGIVGAIATIYQVVKQEQRERQNQIPPPVEPPSIPPPPNGPLAEAIANKPQEAVEGLDKSSEETTSPIPNSGGGQEAPPKPPALEYSQFITGTPITDPRYFFGRQEQLKRIFDLLKRHPLQNAVIIGAKRSGKTSLLHYLKTITTTPPEQLRAGQKFDWLPDPQRYRWIFVDFQDSRMASRERLLGYILECLGMPMPSPCDLDKFMDAVGNLHAPTVILLDEIGVGLKSPELDDTFWECFRSWASHFAGGNLAFVLATPESPIDLARNTGHTSPFFNIFGYTATLRPLTEQEARELIASSPIPFPPQDVEWILSRSKCWPLLLQILCRERLFSLENGESGDDWREHALQQIQPFAHLL